MFARHAVGAAILGIAILSACAPGSSGSSLNSAAVQPTFSATQQAAIGPNKDCGGTNGVKVLPCPIRLTRHTKDRHRRDGIRAGRRQLILGKTQLML
jgi:hypothetical protein